MTKKPWYRPRNAILTMLLLVAVVIIWIVVEILRVYSAEPSASTNYRLQFRERVQQATGVSTPDGERSWAMFEQSTLESSNISREATDLRMEESFLPRDENDTGYVDFARITGSRTIPQDIARERQVLAYLHGRGVLSQLDEFARSPIGLRPTDNGELTTGLPLLPPMMSAVFTKLNGVCRLIADFLSNQRFARSKGSLFLCSVLRV
jgi:hypothetical protein